MKLFWFLLLSVFFIQPCFSQINALDATSIPADLRGDAHSIKREENITFDVYDINEAKLTIHQVFTVLDAEGEDALYFYEYSDQFRKLTDAEIKVFDAQGKQVNKYKMKEINSKATGDGLVPDGKIYYFRVSAPSYPITVQYDYEFNYKGTLNYPDYRIEIPEQSVEQSSYTVNIPSDLDLRYKPQDISIKPAISEKGKDKIYTWEVKDLDAIDYEEGSVSYESNFPAILISPNQFSMDGYAGDMTSWKNFGIWYSQLSKGSINLSDETKSILREMVKNESNDKEKIKKIYKYLQANCRYVSIQLGIGGLKPFDAAFVDSKKYGDCKALTNYMQACLDAVGIVSYPALINAEYNKAPVDPDFPHFSFNHEILCVPGNKDTMWLECTSPLSDAGVLGSFTENRNALLITPTGGVLVSTPKGNASENTFELTTKVKLNEDGSGESESMLKTSGEYKEDLITNVINEKNDEQKEYLVSTMGFLQPDDLVFKSNGNADSAQSTFKMDIENIPSFTAGSKMFLNPRIYKMWKGKLPSPADRTKSFYFPFPFIKKDTTIYFLPENYTVENLPETKNFSFDYGLFKTKYLYDQKANTVTSVTILQLSQNIIPADKFADACKFFANVTDEFNEKIVIKPK
ncbi:MAG TPA: DUF3857 domain-containing protein [Hanamia sp.]|nr:DUF3857 domain-containing protein [Hanamia sp.]